LNVQVPGGGELESGTGMLKAPLSWAVPGAAFNHTDEPGG